MPWRLGRFLDWCYYAGLIRIAGGADRDAAEIYILPFYIGAHPRMGESFTVLDFDDSDSILYLENAGGDRVVREDPFMIADYTVAFETLRTKAIPPEKASSELDTIAKSRFPAQSNDGSPSPR